MKKSLLALVLVVAIGLNLAGCSVGGDNSSLGGSGAVSSGTGESSGAASSKPEEEKRLNLDVLSDLGLTFEQIREKRGELVGGDCRTFTIKYSFEKGYGEYCWSIDNIESTIGNDEHAIPFHDFPMDENGNWKFKEGAFPLPEIGCGLIELKASVFFLGISKTDKFEQIENDYGIKIESKDAGDGYSYAIYRFNKNVTVRILADGNGMITSESSVELYWR